MFTSLPFRVQSFRFIQLILLVAAGLLSGCTGSVHPLLTEKELVDQEDLSGKWELELTGPKNEKQRVVLDFEKYDTSTYDVDGLKDPLAAKSEKPKRGLEWPDAWILQVGTIQGQRFAQLIPRDPPVGPLLVRGIPVYVFGRLEIVGETMKYYQLNDVNSLRLADHAKLQHMTYQPSDMVTVTIFTMPTAELQRAVIEHADELFATKPLCLRRL